MMAMDDRGITVPVWTIGTEVAKVGRQEAVVVPEGGITPERLGQLRDGLAAFLDTPLVSLEAYSLPADMKIAGGRLLDAASPLAQSLTSLIQHSTSASVKVAPVVSAGGEVLYRMVVPAKVAVAMGTSIARPMFMLAQWTGKHALNSASGTTVSVCGMWCP